MKTTIFIIALNLLTIGAFSQDFSNLNDINFNNSEDYKNAEPKVLECSNYLLNNPIDKDELNRLNSFQYLFKWMEGTSDYTFSIGEQAMELTKGKADLLTMYFVSMTKAVLDNSKLELSDDQIQEKATEYLIEYCSNPENNLKPSKKMKKIIKKRNG